jgi:hypothetical protein
VPDQGCHRSDVRGRSATIDLKPDGTGSIQREEQMNVKKLVLVGVAIAALASGVSYAAIPHSMLGVIQSCYKTDGGGLRVIDSEAGQKCNADEKSLTWSQRGFVPKYQQVEGFSMGWVQPQSDRTSAFVECPAGTAVVGGGGRPEFEDGGGAADSVAIVESYPGSVRSWELYAREIVPLGRKWRIHAYAVCASTP